jgi:hypothetical protein
MALLAKYKLISEQMFVLLALGNSTRCGRKGHISKFCNDPFAKVFVQIQFVVGQIFHVSNDLLNLLGHKSAKQAC